jgi:hypothetical protein
MRIVAHDRQPLTRRGALLRLGTAAPILLSREADGARGLVPPVRQPFDAANGGSIFDEVLWIPKRGDYRIYLELSFNHLSAEEQRDFIRLNGVISGRTIYIPEIEIPLRLYIGRKNGDAEVSVLDA